MKAEMLPLKLIYFATFIQGTFISSHKLNQLQSINGDSECIRLALAPVLPQCAKGIELLDPRSRKVSAVRLSICEFENSGLQYPPSCNDISLRNSVAECISSLEQSPQYWTTYSGYYRDLHSICYEESLPWEKDNLIQLFSNITIVYSEFLEELQSAKTYSESSYQGIVSMFSDLESAMKNMLELQSHSAQQVNKNAQSHTEKMSRIFEDSLEIVSRSTDRYSEHILRFGSDIQNVNSEIEQMAYNSEAYFRTTEEMQLEVLQNYKTLSRESELVLQGILNSMNSADIITTRSFEGAGRLSRMMHSNEIQVSEMGNSLQGLGNAILSQQIEMSMVLSDILFNNSQELDIHLAGVLSSYAIQFGEFLDISFSKVDSKLNDTIERIGEIDMTMNHFSNNLGNFTQTINSHIFQLKDSTLFRLIFSLKTWANPLIWIQNGWHFIYKALVYSSVALIMLYIGFRTSSSSFRFLLKFAAIFAAIAGICCGILLGIVFDLLEGWE